MYQKSRIRVLEWKFGVLLGVQMEASYVYHLYVSSHSVISLYQFYLQSLPAVETMV
jgi:hypothetical protein